MLYMTLDSEYHVRKEYGQIGISNMSDSKGRNIRKRLVSINPDPKNNRLVNVRIENTDDNYPLEKMNTLETIQMSLVEVEKSHILFRNIFRSDDGKLFHGECYLRVVPDGKGMKSCKLILKDQNYEIEYHGKLPENLINRVRTALSLYEHNQIRDSGVILIEIFNYILTHPEFIEGCDYLEDLGSCVQILHSLEWSDNIDIKKSHVGIAYYLYTKYLITKNDINIEKNRLILMIFGSDTLIVLLKTIIENTYNNLSEYDDPEAMAKRQLRIMEMHYVMSNIQLVSHFEDILNRHENNLMLVKNGAFSELESVEDIHTFGNLYTNRLYNFLDQKIRVRNNTNFSFPEFK
ncbi:hypothetical protein CEQ90_20325 [Lewinellaceae bacterium SD302]|nr:hypothetical protein CEQ90_20325 [Lewinellaceae bacterium SD302]